jgi:hypothetical protein
LTVRPEGGCITYFRSEAVTEEAMVMDEVGRWVVELSAGGTTIAIVVMVVGSLLSVVQVMVCGTERSI